jgi:hypothetical protein
MKILELRLNPSKSELAWFGLVMLLFTTIVANLVYWSTGSTRGALAIVGLGVALCSFFYSLKPLRLPIYRVWMRAFHPIGWIVSHLILISIYYLVLTPIGLCLRLVGYDPLERRFDPEAESYWVERDPPEQPDRYFRQF